MTDAWPQPGGAIHLLGVGGAGMAALAQCLASAGFEVSGSDLGRTEQTERLESLGIRVRYGHAPGNVAQADLVVISDAIPRDNVELAECRVRGLPVMRRAECLDRLARPRQSVFVAGSHGKSTTTAMIAVMLEAAGVAAGFAVGAPARSLGGRCGRLESGDGVFVAEACEAFRNLNSLRPDIAVITNIEDDHLDHYGSQQALDDAFLTFANRASTAVVLNVDDPGVQRILSRVTAPVIPFGLGGESEVSVASFGFDADGSWADMTVAGALVGRLKLPVPGAHIVKNALAAAACGRLLGLDFAAIASGLARFDGVSHRWQRSQLPGDVLVIDDFAHHPTELATVVDTARAIAHAGRRLVVAFQPQLFSRTARFFRAFAAILADCDSVLLLEVDGGVEAPRSGVSSGLIAEELARLGKVCERFDDAEDFVRRAPDFIRDGDLLVVAGAGSIRTTTGRLSRSRPADGAFPIIAAERRRLSLAARVGRRLKWGRDAPDVASMFRDQAEAYPTQVAVEQDRSRLTYGELDAASDALAAVLTAEGVAAGDVVGVRLRSSIDLIVVAVSLAKLRVVYLPLDLALPSERCAYMLETAGARLAICEAAVLAPGAVTWLAMSALRQGMGATGQGELRAPSPPNGADIAYICFTSGTTGYPKGVPIRHDSLGNLAADVRQRFATGPNARVALNTSISFDISLGEIWMTLSGGGRLCATGSAKPLVGERLAAFLRDRAVTHLSVTPTVLATMRPEMAPSVGCIINVGEACPQSLMDIWAPGRRFHNAYGPTEATIYATASICHAHRKVTIGKPLRGMTATVLDSALRVVARGEVGELCIGGVGVAGGYLARDVETRERFIAGPGASGRLYRTGDMVQMDEHGELLFLGRIDSQIKILGNRIELEEIEQVIRRRPFFVDVAVGADEAAGTPELICFAVMSSRDEFDWATSRRELAEWLPSYMIPARCVLVDEILLTASGKKDRRGMLVKYKSKLIRRGDYVAPRNDVEAKLAGVWKQVLESEADIGVYDDFGWLGGDSLKALLLIMELEKTFEINIPAGYFEGISSIVQMAVQIEDLLWREDRPPEPGAGFEASRVYRQLRDITAAWDGARATPRSLIVSARRITAMKRPATYSLFICVQDDDELNRLAEHLGDDFAVHAMRSGHLVLDYTPASIEQLSRRYVEEITAMPASGRLLIGGVCQGGRIAIPMARMLAEAARPVELLVLLEQGVLTPYAAPVAFFYSEDSFLNPLRKFASGLARYDEIYGDRYSFDLVTGPHGSIHRPPHVQALVAKLRARLAKLPA
jgi:UDP-N-acetylmuramate--L-alanine ligase